MGKHAHQRLSGSTAKQSQSLFMLAEDVSDKEPRVGWGGGGVIVKWGLNRDKDAAKDMAFLPPCVWTRRFARGKRMLSHIPAHSFFLFPFSLADTITCAL